MIEQVERLRAKPGSQALRDLELLPDRHIEAHAERTPERVAANIAKHGLAGIARGNPVLARRQELR